MPDVTVSQQDIDNLGTKLSALGETLTEAERALLLFVLAAAKEAVAQPGVVAQDAAPVAEAGTAAVVTAEEPLPSISEQFSSAFAAEPAQRVLRIPPSIGPMLP